MKMTHRVLAAAVIASAAQAVYADIDTTTPYMGIQGTWEHTDKIRGTDDGLGATVLFGFPTGEYFAPEITLFGLTADNNAGGGSSKQWGGGLDFAVYPLGRSQWFSPFLLVGGGAEKEDRNVNDNTYAYADAGGGFLVNLNTDRTVGIRVDAKHYWTFDDDSSPNHDYLNDTRISAGVQFVLGKKSPPPVAPPPPPPPKDTDGDGVPDNLDMCPGTPPGTQVDAKGCPLPPPPPPIGDSDGDGVPDNVDACPNTPVGMKVGPAGCAVKEAKIVLHDINFEFDSSRLTAASQAQLDNIARGAKGQPTMGLIVEGHTDATGPDAYNLKLSKQRAAAVKTYLVSQGIESSRITTEGYGESKPIASNKTKEGRAENRRVEFKVTKE